MCSQVRIIKYIEYISIYTIFYILQICVCLNLKSVEDVFVGTYWRYCRQSAFLQIAMYRIYFYIYHILYVDTCIERFSLDCHIQENIISYRLLCIEYISIYTIFDMQILVQSAFLQIAIYRKIFLYIEYSICRYILALVYIERFSTDCYIQNIILLYIEDISICRIFYMQYVLALLCRALFYRLLCIEYISLRRIFYTWHYSKCLYVQNVGMRGICVEVHVGAVRFFFFYL